MSPLKFGMIRLRRVPLWVRLLGSAWLVVVSGGVVSTAWATRVQRRIAIEQARDFATSIHQLTLAGLTGFMITGKAAERNVFLDQIERANHIRGLRVFRSQAVVDQFGAGVKDESRPGALEQHVLRTGQGVYVVTAHGDSLVMRAVLPAVARRDYLGKNCLACHATPEGAVLGAVSMEISLARVVETVGTFRRKTVLVGLLLLLPISALLYWLIRRLVTSPLREMTARMHEIADGTVDLRRRLRLNRSDEIGEATAAFNRVMTRAREQLRAEWLAAEIFENSPEAIVVCDRTATILQVNPAFTRITGYAPGDVIGQTPRILKSGEHDEAFYRDFWNALLTDGRWQGDITNRKKGGELYSEWLSINSVRNEDGEVEYFIAVFTDITERKHAEALITHRANHDALTGLPNRSHFIRRLEQAIAAARLHDHALAVLFMDLDRFKAVNDRLGHAAGDQLLKQAGARIAAAVRKGDVVARLGGDEFTVLAEQLASRADAELVMAKVARAFESPFVVNGVACDIGVSIGCAFFPDDGGTADDLMSHADSGMYMEKAMRSGAVAL